MKEKQRITITGKHWEDIIKLPCFRELQHYAAWTLHVSAAYIDGIPASGNDDCYDVLCYVGDTLIEYDNGDWGVSYKNPLKKL